MYVTTWTLCKNTMVRKKPESRVHIAWFNLSKSPCGRNQNIGFL